MVAFSLLTITVKCTYDSLETLQYSYAKKKTGAKISEKKKRNFFTHYFKNGSGIKATTGMGSGILLRLAVFSQFSGELV